MAVTQRPAATTLWAAIAVSASVDILEMAPTVRTSTSAKKKMEVAMPMHSALTSREGDSASVKLDLEATASSVLILMNALPQGPAIGMPLAPTTLGPMRVPVMLAIRAMETTFVLTLMNVQRLLMFVLPLLATKVVKIYQALTVVHAAMALQVTGKAVQTLMNVQATSAVYMQPV